jgi:hypothetical protein
MAAGADDRARRAVLLTEEQKVEEEQTLGRAIEQKTTEDQFVRVDEGSLCTSGAQTSWSASVSLASSCLHIWAQKLRDVLNPGTG